ncbi:B12-binding domain-containing radical SAM protein [candidate division KSB1 bacterium]
MNQAYPDISKMKDLRVALACPPMLVAVDSWKYAPYHKWKFNFSHDNYGYSGSNLGIAYIASELRKHGVRVLLTDGYLQDLDYDEQAKLINNFKPHLIGITVMSNVNIGDAKGLAYAIQNLRCNAPIILGGHYPSVNPQRLFEEVPQAIAIGCSDGEWIMKEICKAICDRRPLDEIPYLILRNNTNNCIRKQELPSLDSYGSPSRDTLEEEVKLGFVPGISSSRGCSNRCLFCAPTLYQKMFSIDHWRSRSPENVVHEIEGLINNEFVKRYKYVDLNFLNGKAGQKRAKEIAVILNQRNIRIPFMFDARVDCLNYNVLDSLKKVGLWGVYLGIESCSQDQLNRFGKMTTVNQNDKAIFLIKKLNLNLLPGTITFDPWATPEEIYSSIRYLHQIGGFNIYRFARGIIPREKTVIFEKYKQEGALITTEWDYTIRCFNKDVQRFFEVIQYLAEQSFLLERDLHKQVTYKYSITDLPDKYRRIFKEMEEKLKKTLYLMTKDCADCVLNNRPFTKSNFETVLKDVRNLFISQLGAMNI